MRVQNQRNARYLQALSDRDQQSDFLKGAEGSMSSQNSQQIMGMISQIFKMLMSMFSKG